MEPEHSGSSPERLLGTAPARPWDTWEQFYARGSWTYRRDAGRGASRLSRSTDAGCADCQYEPDDWSVCRALHRFFCAVSRLSLAASSSFIQDQRHCGAYPMRAWLI